jgi:hypothetical protein
VVAVVVVPAAAVVVGRRGGISAAASAEGVARKRLKAACTHLFDADQGDVPVLARVSRALQRVKELAAAQHHARDAVSREGVTE